MISLDNFYTSKPWIRLTQQIRLERVNAEGELICEHCGRPITQKFDAICHHKIHLTPANVTDASVALNPDNIEVVHHACHNRIHDKLGSVRREVFLVYGPPCSGKSTYVDSVIEKTDLLVDIDLIRKTVSGTKTHVLVPALNPIIFGIRDYLYDSIKTKRGYWKNAYVVGGYPLISERERLCNQLGAREIYIDTPREECLRRLQASPDGRNISEWTRFIDQWFTRYTPRQAVE